jgi:HEAT repeat protein
MSAELLRAVVAVEAALLVIALSAVIAHAILLARADRTLERRMRIGRELLLASAAGQMDDDIVGRLRRLGRRTQIRLLAELAPSLEGAQRATLTVLATRLGLAGRAERRSRSRLWWRRLYAARVLTLIDGGVETMPRLFRDPHQLVRTQVAEWATLHPTPAILVALVGMLDDPRRIARFAVQDTLLRVGQPAVAVLIGALTQMSSRGIASGLLVAERMAGPELLPLGLSLVDHPDSAVRAGSALLLGATGDADTPATLGGLLSDPSAEVRQAAAGALGRLRHWPSAAILLPLLGDPTWPVRRESALALVELGAPGSLILRMALRGHDRFAADIAAQALGAQAPRP